MGRWRRGTDMSDTYLDQAVAARAARVIARATSFQFRQAPEDRHGDAPEVSIANSSADLVGVAW